MTPNVPLLAWVPDSDPTVPGVIIDVEQLLPTARGYAPERALSASSWDYGAVPAAICGAALLHFSEANSTIFAGTTTDLYNFAASAVNDVSSGTYAAGVGPSTPWRFASFGNVALAAHGSNVLQAKSAPDTATAFVAVSGGPKAATICVQSNFVMLGETTESSWSYGDGYWCSALGDHTNWTPDPATQCEQGRLTQTPGPIVRMIAFGADVIAFKRTSMLRGRYIGDVSGGAIWDWKVVSRSIGIVAHDAVCEADGVLYWLSDSGFYQFNGGNAQRINDAPFDWMVRSMTDQWVYLIPYVQAQWDRVRRLVRWYYPLVSGFSSLDGGVALHPDTGRWGRFSVAATWALNTFSDSVYRPTNPDAKLEYEVPAVFTTSNRVRILAGSPVASTITTGDVGDDDIATAMTRVRARFVSAPTISTLTHYYRSVLSDSLTTGVTQSRTDGRYDISHGARWHRFKLSQTGNYELLGFSVEPASRAKR